MKNTIGKLCLILTLCLMVVNCFAAIRPWDFVSKNKNVKIYYTIIDKQSRTIKVTYKNDEFDSYKGTVEIPDSVHYRGRDYAVVSIDDSAFFGSQELDSVIIPNTVIEIGEGAFEISSVEYIKMSNSIKKISSGAFAQCGNLKSFVLYESIIDLGENIFENSGIEDLTILCSELTNSVSLNNMPYLTTLTIGENVKTLDKNIFRGCDNIRTINFNAVEFKGLSPWRKKTSIATLNIGDKVAYLTDSFVEGCINLTSVNLPLSLRTINSYAFSSTSITSITLPPALENMGDAIFKNCDSLVEVNLPSNIGVIVPMMFEGCSKLKTIVLPEGLFEIDSAAFRSCEVLDNIVLPPTVEKIAFNAFSLCTSISSFACRAKKPPILDYALTLPENVMVDIDCNYILDYTNADHWKDMRYPCSLEAVTVVDTINKNVYDSKRERTFTERIINTGYFSFVITNDGERTVSMIKGETEYREDINREINIPYQISYNGVIYTITGIEGLNTCKKVFLPQTIKNIKYGIFDGIDLNEIAVDENNTTFASNDGVLYSKDMTLLIAYPANKLNSEQNGSIIILPESVEEIAFGAFTHANDKVLKLGKNILKVGATQDVQGFDVDELNTNLVTDSAILYNEDKSEIVSSVKDFTPYGKTITIPDAVKLIDDKVFLNADFDTLKVLCNEPPQIFENTFAKDKSFVTIVPIKTKSLYASKPYWQKQNIQEQSQKKSIKAKKSKRKSSKRK